MGRDTEASSRTTDPDRIQIHLGGHAGLVEDLADRRGNLLLGSGDLSQIRVNLGTPLAQPGCSSRVPR